jgi:hypothetical protein
MRIGLQGTRKNSDSLLTHISSDRPTHSFQSKPYLAKLGPTGFGQAQKLESESQKYLTKVC